MSVEWLGRLVGFPTMLVFVDYEHADGFAREHGPAMLAARTRITYALEDLAGKHCHLVRYDRIDQALLERLGAEAIFISGNSVTPDDYSPEALRSVHSIIRETSLPIFGFCGGLQLMGQALGVDIVPLPHRSDIDDDPTLTATDAGRPYEVGYHPVDLSADWLDHPLLDGLGDRPVFRHAHGLHLPVPPPDFGVLASTPITPTQLAVHEERRLVGSQFHPEYWTEDHPAGSTLIANFLRWAGIAGR